MNNHRTRSGGLCGRSKIVYTPVPETTSVSPTSCRIGFITILIVLLLSYASLVAADPPTVDGVAGKLSCYCGTCPHLTVSMCGCSTADQIKSDIKKMISQGMSEQQIIASFIAEHGDTVLAAPPRSGFNWTAWMVPFVAFLGGGIALFTFLKRQQRPPEDPPEPPQIRVQDPAKTQDDELYRQKVDEELEKLK